MQTMTIAFHTLAHTPTWTGHKRASRKWRSLPWATARHKPVFWAALASGSEPRPPGDSVAGASLGRGSTPGRATLSSLPRSPDSSLVALLEAGREQEGERGWRLATGPWWRARTARTSSTGRPWLPITRLGECNAMPSPLQLSIPGTRHLAPPWHSRCALGPLVIPAATVTRFLYFFITTVK